MSKPMVVTLPFVLLLLDVWPLGRVQPRLTSSESTVLVGLVREKVPFFVLSGLACLVTFLAQSEGGAVRSLAALPFSLRLENAALACLDYVAQCFWPANLAVIYPMLDPIPIGSVILSTVVLALVTIWACSRLRLLGWRVPLAGSVGWFWFLGMLMPVIGLVQVGMQQRADRYTYLPLIGLFILIVWSVDELVRPRWTKAAISGAVVLACAFLANHQIGYWRNSEQLFRHALQVTRTNFIAHNNLGYALFTAGRTEEAIAQYEAALRINPDYDDAHDNLGRALAAQAKYGAAQAQFEAALKLRPDDFKAHDNLGNTLALQGRHAEAIREFQEALRLRPDHVAARINLAISYRETGNTAEAVAEYRQALRWKPDSLEALNNLAWILATSVEPARRNGAEAVALAGRACQVTHFQHPVALATLAAAYAETGRFAEAIECANRARSLSGGAPTALAAELASMLAAFQSRLPFRAP